MVRRGFILFLAMLVVTQVSCSKYEVTEDGETTTNSDEEDESEEEEVSSRQPSEPSTTAPRVTRTTSVNSLQCFICSFKWDSSERHCLEPLNYNVSSMYCRTPDDKCFTVVEKSESGVSIVVRGCKSDCTNSYDMTCCETDRCNGRPVADRPTRLPTLTLRTVSSYSAASKCLPQTVLYFVTVLLLLKAVVQVNIV